MRSKFFNGVAMTRLGWRSVPAAAWVLFASALLAAIGAFLPWVVARVVIGQITKSGVQGDGVVTLILGFVVLLIAGFVLTRRGPWQVLGGAALLATLGILGIAIYDSADLSDRAKQFHLTSSGRLSVGGGLWVTILAGLIGIVGTGVLLIRHDG
jgi:hypothetical protein